MSTNVNLWFAYDEFNSFINIKDADVNHDYICPECGDIVRARAKSSDLVSEHFYHINKGECNGESAIHKYWKENYIHIGQKVNLPGIGEVYCVDMRVECKLNTKNGIYQPDLVIKTDDIRNQYIIFEIYNTNKKSHREYDSLWRDVNKLVYEINVNKIHKDKAMYSDEIQLIFDPKKIENINKIQNKINIIEKISCESYDNIYSALNIIKRLKRGVKVKKTTLDGLIYKIDKNFVSRDEYRKVVIPLKEELEKIKKYCY